MTLTASTQFPSGTLITAVDTTNDTITVADLPGATGTNRLARISVTKGMYFIESGSLVAPANQSLTARNVTGSGDSEYNNLYNKWGLISPISFTGSASTGIVGDYSQYLIHEVVARHNTTTLSVFITSSKGVNSEPDDKQPTTTAGTFALVELGFSSSIASTFSPSDISIGGGYGPAAMQIAAGRLIDKLTSGSGGGGTGVGFPFTGSAQITGSLAVTGSTVFSLDEGSTDDIFLIKGNTTSSGSITVNNEGILRLQWSGSTPPDAVEGGLYYSASAFYAGLE